MKKVLVVDDSALMRQLLSQIINSANDLTVVGTARDPYDAWQKVRTLEPDVLSLDVEMPRMDGIEFLQKLMAARPTPVVMVSTLTEANSETTLRALELGAIDYISKPKLDIQSGTIALADQIIEKLRIACQSTVRRCPIAGSASKKAQPVSAQGTRESSHKLIAIGASTGGTGAIMELLRDLPADAPGTVIVQHMPVEFTSRFAERLNNHSRMQVREAQSGDRVVTGSVLLAPGGRHLEVVRKGASLEVQLNDRPPVNRFRPSVDVLFDSVAEQVGRHSIGVILTGMGDDGARGLERMQQAGAHTIAQDKESCVVFGMPKAAIDRGAVDTVCSLADIASVLQRSTEGVSAV